MAVGVKLTTFSDPKQFLEFAEADLEKHETANGVILGIANRIAGDPSLIENEPYFGVVKDDQTLVAAAMITPPHGVALSSEYSQPTEALELIVNDLIEKGWLFEDVNGPKSVTEQFAKLWAQRVGVEHKLDMEQRLYELREVTAPQGVPGQMRTAVEEEIPLIVEWRQGFHRDAFGSELSDLDKIKTQTQKQVAAGNWYLWEDQELVSMAIKSRSTKNGVTVSAVYTPPEFRRQGYASALVAALSQKLLDDGYQFCVLFTDLANKTSNNVYMKIGYKALGDYDKYVFAYDAKKE